MQSERNINERLIFWLSVRFCSLNAVLFQREHVQSQTLLQMWRWCWAWVLWCCSIHIAISFPSRSCTNTRQRRARLGATWAPNPATERATLHSPLLSGCSQSAPCTTVSEPVALCGSTPEGWSLMLNPLTHRGQTKENTETRGFKNDKK